MTKERFIEILNSDNYGCDWIGDNAWQGLNILAKYLPKEATFISAAEHDVIYSIDAEELVQLGITEEDAKNLRDLNWGIDSDNDCLYCFI